MVCVGGILGVSVVSLGFGGQKCNLREELCFSGGALHGEPWCMITKACMQMPRLISIICLPSLANLIYVLPTLGQSFTIITFTLVAEKMGSLEPTQQDPSASTPELPHSQKVHAEGSCWVGSR